MSGNVKISYYKLLTIQQSIYTKMTLCFWITKFGRLWWWMFMDWCPEKNM